jgi:hypothetical protein
MEMGDLAALWLCHLVVFCCQLIVESFGRGVVCGPVQVMLIGNCSVIFIISCCSRDWRVGA